MGEKKREPRPKNRPWVLLSSRRGYLEGHLALHAKVPRTPEIVVRLIGDLVFTAIDVSKLRNKKHILYGPAGLQESRPDILQRYSTLPIDFSLGSRESLDRVAQHGPRHLPAVFSQEGFLGGLIPFSHLPQHPADRFLDEILLVMEENLADSQGVFKLLLLDEPKRRQDRNSPFPQHGRMGEPVKRFPAPEHQEIARNVGRGEIDEIPVVDPSRAFQVESVNPFLPEFIFLFEFAD